MSPDAIRTLTQGECPVSTPSNAGANQSNIFVRTATAEIGPIPEITVELRQLKMRLSPLYHVQTVLIEHLACQFDGP